MDNNIIMSITEILGKENVMIDEPMSSHTTFRIGGVADLYLTPKTINELSSLVKILREKNIKYYIIGNGSNLLVSDNGIRAVIIEFGKSIGEIGVNGDLITAEAGVLLSRLAKTAMRNGLSGLEFASGIPGSLGGAVYMNAGAYGGEMKDVITEVTYLDKDFVVKTIANNDCDFGYRHSVFTDTDKIILSAKMKLEAKDKDEIKQTMKELTEKRVSKQPVDKASGGSTFKRPTGYYAAAIIEEVGLKGYSVGGASVSEKHSGFVVNNGGATAKDVCAVIEHVQNVVKERYGFDLETEIKFLGEF